MRTCVSSYYLPKSIQTRGFTVNSVITRKGKKTPFKDISENFSATSEPEQWAHEGNSPRLGFSFLYVESRGCHCCMLNLPVLEMNTEHFTGQSQLMEPLITWL